MTLRAMMALGLALGTYACGDDSSHHSDAATSGHDDHDEPGSGHAHTSCGLQENCPDDAPDLSSGPTAEGEHFSFMVHSPSDYGPGRGDIIAASMMLHFEDGEGEALADTALEVYTFSDDCGHEGPTPPAMLTTNADGMVEFDANFGHGGPWSIVAELTSDGTSDKIELALCIPGEEHGSDRTDANDEDADHSQNQADDDGEAEHDGADDDGDQETDQTEEE